MIRSIFVLCLLLPVLAFASGSIIDHGDGTVTFEVVLPSGQDYVEVFSRQNGIQNLAQDITPSEIEISDGNSVYRYTTGGYQPGDEIEYRFYSFLPDSQGVFTPGPMEQEWYTTTYGPNKNVFKTEDKIYKRGKHDGKFIAVYQHSDLSYVQPMQTGWALFRAEPQDLAITIPPGYLHAEFKGLYVKPCESDVWMNIQNTPYAYPPSFAIITLMPAFSYEYDITYTYSFYPGTQPSDTYACGGHYITIDTRIGPQQVRTDATVEFAYVIEFTK